MINYVIRRLLFGVVLIFLSTIVSFTILKLSPGKPGAAMLDPRVSKEFLEAQNRIFGTDRPPIVQYLNWIGVSKWFGIDNRDGLFQGSMGDSWMYKQPVGKVIRSRLNASLVLNITSLLLTWFVAVPLGIYAAVHHYKWADKLVSLFSFAGMSLPTFFMALLLLWIFAGELEWLPPGGLTSLDHDKMSLTGRLVDYGWHLIIPVAVLVLNALASLQRVMRGNMLETLRQQYITTARAKGLSETRVRYKHALRNAINPMITLLGFEFAGLFGGAALLENVI